MQHNLQAIYVTLRLINKNFTIDKILNDQLSIIY